MRVCIMEGPVDLYPGSEEWRTLAKAIKDAKPDLLLTNEMPFGPWLAALTRYDADKAAESVRIHEEGLEALHALHLPCIISSRPVAGTDRLANEAFVLQDGEYRFLHHKHYFPRDAGFYEHVWFAPTRPGFEVAEVAGVKVGVQLCTELMFNERSRAYGRAGAELIVVPRASGTSTSRWMIAGAMAAITSGCYVLSSNRVGTTQANQTFGGTAFAFAPDGELLARSSEGQSLLVVDIDPARARAQQLLYPCNVEE